MKLQKILLRGSIFFWSIFQLGFAAAELFEFKLFDEAIAYDFLHVSSKKVIDSDYLALHVFLKKSDYEKKKNLLKSLSGEGMMTPLHSAVMQRNFAAIYFLLEHGADKNIKNIFGITPFDMAIGSSEEERLFFDFYQSPRTKRQDKGVFFTESQLAEAQYEIFRKLSGAFWENAPNWNYFEELLWFMPKKWIRDSLLSQYDFSEVTLLYKAIMLERLDWILFLLRHQVDSHKLINNLDLTYQDIIKEKIEKHRASKKKEHEEGFCFRCELSQKICSLLEVYELCFEKKSVKGKEKYV